MTLSSGFSLIETLVSMLLILITFMGINAAHLAAIKEAKAVYYYSVALMQVKMMAATLTASDVRQDADIEAMYSKQIVKMLPQGRLVLRQGDSTISAIDIFWGGEASNVCERDKIAQAGCMNFKMMA